MLRILTLLVLLPLVWQTTHLEREVMVCAQPCDEAEAGDCAPGCSACLCCRHPRAATLPTTSAAPDPEPTERRFVLEAASPPQPRPAEIFHVPRTPGFA